MDPTDNTETLNNLIERGENEMFKNKNYEGAEKIFWYLENNAPSFRTYYVNALLTICRDYKYAENKEHHDSKKATNNTEQIADNARKVFVDVSVGGGREAIKDKISECETFSKNIPFLENTVRAGTSGHSTKDDETLMDYAQEQHQENYMHSHEKKTEENKNTEYVSYEQLCPNELNNVEHIKMDKEKELRWYKFPKFQENVDETFVCEELCTGYEIDIEMKPVQHECEEPLFANADITVKEQEEQEAKMLHNSLKMRSNVLQIGIRAFASIPNYRTDVDFEKVSLELDDLILRARTYFFRGNDRYEYYISEAEEKYSDVAIILPKKSEIKQKNTNTNKNNSDKTIGNTAMTPEENKKSVSYKGFVKGDNIDVVKCLKLAETALIAEDFIRAERLIKKSERICPTKNAQELLKKLESARKEANERNAAKEAAELAVKYAAESAAKEAKKLDDKKTEELNAKKIDLSAKTAEEPTEKIKDFKIGHNFDKSSNAAQTETVEQIVNEAQNDLDINDCIKAEKYVIKPKRLDPEIDIGGLQESQRIAIASRRSTNTGTDLPLVIEDEVQLTDNKKQNSKQYLNVARRFLNEGDITQAEINLFKASEHYNSMDVRNMFKDIENLKALEKDSYKIPKPNYVDSCSENNFALCPGEEETPSYHLANSNSEKNKAEEYLKKGRLALTHKNFDKAEEYANRCVKIAPVRAKGLLSDIKESKEMSRETMILRSGRILNTNNDETRCVSQKHVITSDQNECFKGNSSPDKTNENKAESLQIESELLRAQSESTTINSEHGQPSKLSDGGYSSGTNIELNKEAYYSCIEKAKQAFFDKDYITVERLVKKAYRMYPGEEAKLLIEKIQIAKKMSEEVKYSCQNPDTHNERPLHADYNQIEAKKCVKLAEEAYALGDLDRAERLFVKASRMDSSKTIQDYLAKVREEKKMKAGDLCKNADDNSHTSAEGTLKTKNAEKLNNFALDAINLKCYYSAESYLNKANYIYPNQITTQLLEKVRAAIQTSLANTHSEQREKIVTVEKQKQMKMEAAKYLKMAEDKIKLNDLDNAQSFAILSDSFCKSDDSRKLLKRIFDLKYKDVMNINNKKLKKDQNYNYFKSERYIEIAETAFMHGEFLLAEEYLIQSNKIYCNPKADEILVKVRAAIKREADDTYSNQGGGWVKKRVDWFRETFL